MSSTASAVTAAGTAATPIKLGRWQFWGRMMVIPYLLVVPTACEATAQVSAIADSSAAVNRQPAVVRRPLQQRTARRPLPRKGAFRDHIGSHRQDLWTSDQNQLIVSFRGRVSFALFVAFARQVSSV